MIAQLKRSSAPIIWPVAEHRAVRLLVRSVVFVTIGVLGSWPRLLFAAEENTTRLAFVGPRGVVARTLLGNLGLHWLLALGAALMMALAMNAAVLTGRRASTRLQRRPSHQTHAGAHSWLKMRFWYALRITSIGLAVAMAIVLCLRPQVGLFMFWRLFIPLVPLLFFVAPGLWRNICPMAALNQTPRLFDFGRALTPPRWLQKYGYLIAITLFLVLVASRKVLFNQNGPALAALILASLTGAFVMGSFFKGKSGWCSSICPLLPVQRIYGQTPFVTVAHAHCEPCLACTKNCYDLSPKQAYLADLYDPDQTSAGMRKLFAGLFPGFVLAFFLIPSPPDIPIWTMYGLFAAAGMASLATFWVVEAVVKTTSNKLTVLYGAAALNIYYWFNAVALGSLLGKPAPVWFVWGLRSLVLGLTLVWIYRTYRKETEFIALTLAPSQVVAAPQTNPAAAAASALPAGRPTVTVEPAGLQLAVEKNCTLLEVLERNNLPIEAGCRMGLCGADPVHVMGGMDCLSKVGADERTTLERLALGPQTRMACMARVRGDVKLSLTPQQPDVHRSSVVAGFHHDAGVRRVVIIGNGIAGVTAADHIRRRHPTCEIHLVSREPHHLYNRMGITRLIYGRSAMQGLHLLPEQWYADFNITCWLNTRVTGVDADTRTVHLGTGETLPYDRLILTTGSQSFVPPIAGYGMAGTFVLRTAEDAMAIRAYVQTHGCRQAVVAGGGLLGLEAAYALSKLGLQVTVLERSPSLLTRQLDQRGAVFLREYLEAQGIAICTEAETAAVAAGAHARVQTVMLKDGQSLPCDIFLAAAGIRAESELAQRLGLAVEQGIVVDAQMRTSDPHVFAAGDVAQMDNQLHGLWAVAVSQAEVAAANAVAAPGAQPAVYVAAPPVTMLKVAGIDLTSIGRVHAQGDEVELALEEPAAHRYRKLVLADGKIVGAILLGYPLEAPGVAAAVKEHIDVSADLATLRAGDWARLAALA